jgi:hypothetical protein
MLKKVILLLSLGGLLVGCDQGSNTGGSGSPGSAGYGTSGARTNGPGAKSSLSGTNKAKDATGSSSSENQ